MREIATFAAYARNHPIGRRTPIATASRYLGWQLKSRLRSGPFEQPWVENTRLSVRRGMLGATGNVYFGLHEFADMAFVLHLLRPNDLFFDIGANVGAYTVLAAGVAGADCWAFEPAPETLPLFKENIRLNGLEGKVRLFDCALGDADGEIVFTRGEDTINRVADADFTGATQRVPLARLDSLARDAQPLMMKNDVEGHEEATFAGADELLSRRSLRAIEVETVSDAVLAQLARHGFERRYYDGFARSLNAREVNHGANNQLFIRDEAFVADRLRSARRLNIAGVML